MRCHDRARRPRRGKITPCFRDQFHWFSSNLAIRSKPKLFYAAMFIGLRQRQGKASGLAPALPVARR
jgi:hypothetical protein